MEQHDDDIEGDMEMADVSVQSASSDEYSVEIEEGSSSLDLENEYGEQTITPRTITKSNISKADGNSDDFYKTTVRRQNCCFGLSMISFAGLFIAAYFYMGMSFTPSNIGIFGDESSMKGGSGKINCVLQLFIIRAMICSFYWCTYVHETYVMFIAQYILYDMFRT